MRPSTPKFLLSAEKERKEFTERLIIALSNCELTPSPTALCKLLKSKDSNLELSVHAVRKWLHGESVPTQAKLKLLADTLRVKSDWLRFGEEIKLAKEKGKTHKSKASLLKEYEHLNLNQKKYMLEIMKALVVNNNKKFFK
jgi:transcriptional regulator with XRE-family HTH domain